MHREKYILKSCNACLKGVKMHTQKKGGALLCFFGYNFFFPKSVIFRKTKGRYVSRFLKSYNAK